MESALAQRLPGADVGVYGRHRDFQAALERGADAAIALSPVLTAYGLTVANKSP
jgi:hypothetical protein